MDLNQTSQPDPQIVKPVKDQDGIAPIQLPAGTPVQGGGLGTERVKQKPGPKPGSKSILSRKQQPIKNQPDPGKKEDRPKEDIVSMSPAMESLCRAAGRLDAKMHFVILRIVFGVKDGRPTEDEKQQITEVYELRAIIKKRTKSDWRLAWFALTAEFAFNRIDVLMERFKKLKEFLRSKFGGKKNAPIDNRTDGKRENHSGGNNGGGVSEAGTLNAVPGHNAGSPLANR